MVDELKQIVTFNKTEAAVYVMMGINHPFQFAGSMIREEEWKQFPKPIRNPEEESIFAFNERTQKWREEVGEKVRKRLAYHLSEKLKKL